MLPDMECMKSHSFSNHSVALIMPVSTIHDTERFGISTDDSFFAPLSLASSVLVHRATLDGSTLTQARRGQLWKSKQVKHDDYQHVWTFSLYSEEYLICSFDQALRILRPAMRGTSLVKMSNLAIENPESRLDTLCGLLHEV